MLTREDIRMSTVSNQKDPPKDNIITNNNSSYNDNTATNGEEQQHNLGNNHEATSEMTTTTNSDHNNHDQTNNTLENQQQLDAADLTNSNKQEEEEEKLLDILIDDVIFSECLQVHRAAKMGMIFTEPGDEMYKIKDGNGLDVFGQPLNKKKQLNCTCPQCGRNIAAARLAPHLEKCMGMGRLSARAASNKRDTSSSQL